MKYGIPYKIYYDKFYRDILTFAFCIWVRAERSETRTITYANFDKPKYWVYRRIKWFISTTRLNALRHLHLWPINPVIFRESMSSHLGVSFALICFQRLSIPNLATQRCSWQNNWYTRGWFIPVLSSHSDFRFRISDIGFFRHLTSDFWHLVIPCRHGCRLYLCPFFWIRASAYYDGFRYHHLGTRPQSLRGQALVSLTKIKN